MIKENMQKIDSTTPYIYMVQAEIISLKQLMYYNNACFHLS